ncbi:MAG: hypothetical protein IKS15_03455 [Opitutales bacterium]|nr:hypothetical protein [Opitutales bacterium]
MENDIERLERELAQIIGEMQAQIENLELEISQINEKLEDAAGQLQNIRQQI